MRQFNIYIGVAALAAVLAACVAVPEPTSSALPASPMAVQDHAVLNDALAVSLDRQGSVQLLRSADAVEGVRRLADSGADVTQLIYEIFDEYTVVAPAPPQPLTVAEGLQVATEYGARYLVNAVLEHWQDDVTPLAMRKDFRKLVFEVADLDTRTVLFSSTILVPDNGDEAAFQQKLRRALAQLVAALYKKQK